MESWLTHLISFLFGTATGASGSYFATKYTDKRRKNEERNKLKSIFKEIQGIMPELIREMKNDFNDPKSIAIREFAILPNDRVLFNSGQSRFIYYENQHSDLRGKVSILENHNFVYDVTPGNTPIFRITEDFWKIVQSTK